MGSHQLLLTLVSFNQASPYPHRPLRLTCDSIFFTDIQVRSLSGQQMESRLNTNGQPPKSTSLDSLIKFRDDGPYQLLLMLVGFQGPYYQTCSPLAGPDYCQHDSLIYPDQVRFYPAPSKSYNWLTTTISVFA